MLSPFGKKKKRNNLKDNADLSIVCPTGGALKQATCTVGLIDRFLCTIALKEECKVCCGTEGECRKKLPH